jgi:8-oxo-dGTP pyrophosphatase MutT (NUDIX family)
MTRAGLMTATALGARPRDWQNLAAELALVPPGTLIDVPMDLDDDFWEPGTVTKSRDGAVAICDEGHEHSHPLGAAGMLIRAPRPSGEMAYLLQKRSSKAKDSPSTWSTFGGGLEPGESPLDGAKREIQEELGTLAVSLGSQRKPFVAKVGEEGYVHGWKFVGVPGGAEAVHASFQRNLRRFREAGGSVIESSGHEGSLALHRDSVEAVGRSIRKKTDREAWDSDLGVKFTRDALNSASHMPGARVIVAAARSSGKGKDKTAGAATVYEHDGALHVDLIGTTGLAPGAGTALARKIAEVAAAKNLPVLGEPYGEEAESFWQKLGWHPDPLDDGSPAWGWTAAEAAELAAARERDA